MLYLATFFDINYLTRGLALLHSLQRHSSQPFILYIVALDKKVVDYFKKNNNDNENVKVISINEIEDHFSELKDAKKNRSVVEYFFTLSPVIPLYILDKFPETDRITSMDADLFFFDDPSIIFNEFADASILITPHNFTPVTDYLLINGKYNVSFQSFKNNETGRACLETWKAQCIEWCHDHLDEEHSRYADQKYLDAWPSKYKNVAELNLEGAGLAPWNIENYSYEIKNGKVYVNNKPLIFFHFHHLRIFNKNFAVNGLAHYHVNVARDAVRLIYHTYLKELSALAKKNRNAGSTVNRIKFKGSGFVGKIVKADRYWFFTNDFITSITWKGLNNRFKNYLRRRLWHS